jgi:hypothetical protein
MTDTTITLPIANDLALIPAKGMERTANFIITAGQGFGAFLAAYGRAVELAYCGPFQAPIHGGKYSLDEELEGRDPNW